MKLPFTTDQFFQIFEKYNTGVFPAQTILFLLAVTALILMHLNVKSKNLLTGLILAICWIWTGLVYHIVFFSSINKPAFVFGLIFLIQGGLILKTALQRNKPEYSASNGIKDYFGYFLMLYGLVIYPLVNYLITRNPAETISIGLPCPTTIFTFGVFLMVKNRFPKYLLIIPSLWALVGVSAALNLGVYQDSMILVSAIISGGFLLKSSGKVPQTTYR